MGQSLDKKKEYYESKGYKVIFVVHHNSFQNAARAVIYDKETHIPQCMQDYRHKYVKLNGVWMNEGLLGICDKCGEYKELICLCDKGSLCAQCDKEDN